MSKVEFESDYNPDQVSENQSSQSGIVALLIKLGIIKDESQAKGILLGVVVACLALTALVIYFLF